MLPSEDTKQEKSNTIDGFNRKQSEASTISSLTLFEEYDNKLIFATDNTEGDDVIFDKEGKILGNDMDNCLNASITVSSNHQVTDLDEGMSSNATTTNQVTIL